ncbi:MAG: hypothetical protein Q8L66_07585 [Caulobacter sp.]|nr:hypothetical protein [Caulobacter sp.]
MWEVISLVRRIVEGSVLAVLLIVIVAVLGASETINLLIADRGVSSIIFLLVLTILLADLIAKFIGVVSATFPDLLPKLSDENVKRASLIRRMGLGQTVALLSGAYAARLALFLVIFVLLGMSYASAPKAVQETLFGDFGALAAIDAFLREGVAGSIGYFLFFLGPDNLKPITNAIVTEPLVSSTVNGDVFLVGLRLYGLALILAALRTLLTPIIYARARIRSRGLAAAADPAA